MLKRFAYVRPASLQEALKHLSSEGARVHAGGTDLLGCLREQTFEAKTVVSISGIDSLRGIRKSGSGGLRIGALTTITEVAENPEIQRNYTALARAASEVASPQLRNQETPMLVLSRRVPLPAKRRGAVFCRGRRKRFSLHLGWRKLLHRPSFRHGARACGPRCKGSHRES